jgi:hypothetical protein
MSPHTLVAITLAAATATAAIAISSYPAFGQGEQRRASSTVYTKGAKDILKYRSHRKYRYTYRRSRSRAAAVSARAAAAVSQQASRDASISVPAAQVHPPHRAGQTDAGQMLLTDIWPAMYLFRPYYHPFEAIHIEPMAQWDRPVMLERGDDEPAPATPSSLHFAALGALTAAFAAACYFAVTGGQHERPAARQWADHDRL